jgi:hypothetical protein
VADGKLQRDLPSVTPADDRRAAELERDDQRGDVVGQQ